jgi:hypothetical protein
MLKKLINRNEGSQLEMNDSALRDIIPSNDMTIIKVKLRILLINKYYFL